MNGNILSWVRRLKSVKVYFGGGWGFIVSDIVVLYTLN